MRPRSAQHEEAHQPPAESAGYFRSAGEALTSKRLTESMAKFSLVRSFDHLRQQGGNSDNEVGSGYSFAPNTGLGRVRLLVFNQGVKVNLFNRFFVCCHFGFSSDASLFFNK